MNGVATQSSERSSNPASRAIDGVTKFPSCSHTSEHTVNSFLMVDIKKIAEIFQITIFNRIDDVTAMRRLKNFSILLERHCIRLKFALPMKTCRLILKRHLNAILLVDM